jgi:hypothetical protein
LTFKDLEKRFSLELPQQTRIFDRLLNKKLKVDNSTPARFIRTELNKSPMPYYGNEEISFAQ